MAPSLLERKWGCFLGLAVGDAMGVPYEFKPPENIPHNIVDMIPPNGYKRAWARIPPGTWSDDTSMMLALHAHLSSGEIRPRELLEEWVSWYHDGKYTVDGDSFDIGHQTCQALAQFIEDGSLIHGHDIHANGNGGLMRVAPAAFLPPSERINGAVTSTILTHAHPISVVCCTWYTEWLAEMLAGQKPKEAWTVSGECIKAMCDLLAANSDRSVSDWSGALQVITERTPIPGSGYVVDTLLNTVNIVTSHDRFDDAILAAIHMSGDTDTTAAVVGAAMGCRLGVKSIPATWLLQMRGWDDLIKYGEMSLPRLEYVHDHH